MSHPDYVIAGAGIIGLSLALELHHRGASVTVLEAGTALAQTSSAAAGMLAVDDPANPPALRPLAFLSASLYPAFLGRIAALSAEQVPFQTSITYESGPDATASLPDFLTPGDLRFEQISEHSVDPRQLAQALLAAVRATSITLLEQTALTRLSMGPASVRIETTNSPISTSALIDCMGSWSPAPVSPRKGQMLAVQIPEDLALDSVIRTPDVYIVPRTSGPNAGRAIIGATIEDAGFDLTVHPLDILTLNARAVKLIPALERAPFLESWSGLRPATADGLPLLGPLARQPRYILATGHFRNGILLAPATAHVLASLLANEPPGIDLAPFAPTRF